MEYLGAVIEGLRVALPAISANLDRAKTEKLSDALRFYKALRDEYDAVDELRKKIGEMLELMSRGLLPEMMADEDVKTMTLADIGYRFTVNQRLSCSIIDKPLGHQWLRAQGQEGIITETVNAQTLSSFAKSHIEDTGQDLPPDIFRISLMFTTSVTKVGGKA